MVIYCKYCDDYFLDTLLEFYKDGIRYSYSTSTLVGKTVRVDGIDYFVISKTLDIAEGNRPYLNNYEFAYRLENTKTKEHIVIRDSVLRAKMDFIENRMYLKEVPEWKTF